MKHRVLGRPRANPSATLRLGSLWPRRDLVPVADAARAVVGSLVAAPSGLTMVNIATGMAVPMQQVLDVIGELRGKQLSISTDLRKVRPVEQPHLQADASRFKALIGWASHSDLRRVLAELLAMEPIG